MNNKFYSYGRQTIGQDDIDAVVEVLKSDRLTQGPKVEEFENTLAIKFKAEYVSVVANGTAGLHLIGFALGWGKDDIVITSPITFLASANCILYAGATPDFVDIDPVSYTIDIKILEQKLKVYEANGKKVKAVVAVDYAGNPCDWESLKQLSDKYKFQLVNDNCHALGAEYKNDIGYAAKYANAVNLSFHPVKHITTGEGGAVLTNNSKLDEKIKILRTHGMTKDQKYLTKNDGPWYYEMHDLGFNYRITDFQCALGSSQLKKLDWFIKKRKEIAEYYNDNFREDDRFIIPQTNRFNKHAYHLYPLQINFDNLKISKNEYFEKLRLNNIFAQVHYIPIHLQPYYQKHFQFREGDFPKAEEFYKKELSMPIYPQLEKDDLYYIVNKFKEFAV